MISFKRAKGNLPNINSLSEFNDSEFSYLLEIFEPLEYEELYYLDCVEEDEQHFELFTFIEANGNLVSDFDSLQLFEFDDKKVVLFNAFDQIYIFCKKTDVTEFSEVF